MSTRGFKSYNVICVKAQAGLREHSHLSTNNFSSGTKNNMENVYLRLPNMWYRYKCLFCCYSHAISLRKNKIPSECVTRVLLFHIRSNKTQHQPKVPGWGIYRGYQHIQKGYSSWHILAQEGIETHLLNIIQIARKCQMWKVLWSD